MKIGIDFDNTLVNYEDLFHSVALNVGFISNDSKDNNGKNIGKSKTDVKDYLRSNGKEDLWTELQGLTYGKYIEGAKIFPEVKNFFIFCKNNNIQLYIISHKTMYPYIGEKHNLHNAAMFWLEQKGFFENDSGITRSNVFLELTKEEKIDRIKSLECDYFIDDLPELLLAETFPNEIKKILFDPNSSNINIGNENFKSKNIIIKNSWKDIQEFFSSGNANLIKESIVNNKLKENIDSKGDHEFDDYTIERIDNLLFDYDGSSIEDWEFTRILGGRNNRAYKIEKTTEKNEDGSTKILLMKVYHHNVKDGRNRIDSEYSFLEYAKSLDIDSVPYPIKRGDNIALYSFIEGRKCESKDLNEVNIKKFIHFFVELNENRITNEHTENLNDASEACFNIDAHISMVDSRIDRLKNIDAKVSEIDSEAVDFISSKLIPKWNEIKSNILSEVSGFTGSLDEKNSSDSEYGLDTKKLLAEGNTCVSPSDFGFHNALINENNDLYFLDFEYAGIDDPAKLVNDFFARPDPAPDIKYYDTFLDAIIVKKLFNDMDLFIKRSKLLLPVYRLKWCCIMLNEFLKSDAERRKFAVSEDIESQKKLQLSKTMIYFEKYFV